MRINFRNSLKIIIAISVLLISALYFLSKDSNDVSITFYHWKSELNLTKEELNKIRELEAARLYVHLFDVDIENRNFLPKAKLAASSRWPSGVEIVPVIYITQRCFNGIEKIELMKLASNLIELTNKILKAANVNWKEIQIDCDWTSSNKDRYFDFLNLLKNEIGPEKVLSATIRLHQIKYSNKTGIPPIDRGMLMFYNMGEIKNYSNILSIYNSSISEKYLAKLSTYPLPLDYALPAFSWGLKYRLGKLADILPDNNLNAIIDSPYFFHYKNIHICFKEGFYEGSYFKKGDLLKAEVANVNICKKAAKQLSKHLNSSKFNVSLYHLGSSELKNYDVKQIQNIISNFN
jgi:hypothetical protein